MLLILFCLLFNVIDGIPLAKLHDTSISFGGISLAEMPNSDLMSQIMSSKDDEEALLSVLSDADPAQINQIITLLKGLLATSRTELDGLITSSDNADTAFNDAVAAHNAAIVAQTDGTVTLQTTRDNAISDANTVYDQGVAALQAAVTAAKSQVDSTNSTKNTANALLAADQARLESEISTLTTVIALMESLLGINTASPTSSPTKSCTNNCVSTTGWTIDSNPVTTCGWMEHICGSMRRGECLEHGGSVKCQWGYVTGNHWANQSPHGSPVSHCCNCKGFQMPENYADSYWPTAPDSWVWNGNWKNTHTSTGNELPICD